VGVDTAAKTISLGILTPLTGAAAAPIGIPLTTGIETYFKYVNDNGGIGSSHYKINLIKKDNKYPDIATQQQDYNDIRNQVLMIAESLGTPTTVAIQQASRDDRMLVAAATLASNLACSPFMIMLGTPYRLQVENAFDYIVNEVGDKTAPVGIIYQHDEYGADGLAGYKEAKDFYSLNSVSEQPFDFGASQAALAAPISALKASGAKYVFVTATPGDAANIIGVGAALNYFPQWIFQSPAYASVLLSFAQLVPLMEHNVWVVGQGADWGDTTKPGMKLMMQNVQKYAPTQKPDGYFEFGYAEAIITTALLQKAAASGDLTRDGLYQAFHGLDVDLGQIYPDAHYGSLNTSCNGRVPTRDNVIYSIDHTAPGGVKSLSHDFIGAAAKVSDFSN
jgi:ABC-type branched-subunit amino acid transport system substrate-binding protein